MYNLILLAGIIALKHLGGLATGLWLSFDFKFVDAYVLDELLVLYKELRLELEAS